MNNNSIKYGRKNKKVSYKYAFSTLIICGECGYSSEEYRETTAST